MHLFQNVCTILKKLNINNHFSRFNSFDSHKPPWNVLFFGADDFSLYSLKTLFKEYTSDGLLQKLEVVTTIKQNANPVQKFAEKHKLIVYNWPLTVSNNCFHLGIVVSFGHLIPDNIINAFPFGILNVHSSLLPRWRGAAPIIYALANGDTETGVTVMRIKPKHFDVGEIVLQEKISIGNETTMPELHQQLGKLGADCLIKTLRNLPENLQNAKPQPTEGITFAPKITPKFAVINWKTMSSIQIYNLGRAVAGYLTPTSTWNNILVKYYGIKDCGSCDILHSDSKIVLTPGFVMYDKPSKTLRIFCANRTWISVEKIAVFGKKVMSASDFNNGYIKKRVIRKKMF